MQPASEPGRDRRRRAQLGTEHAGETCARRRLRCCLASPCCHVAPGRSPSGPDLISPRPLRSTGNGPLPGLPVGIFAPRVRSSVTGTSQQAFFDMRILPHGCGFDRSVPLGWASRRCIESRTPRNRRRGTRSIPDLLRKLLVTRNQVRALDITYIPMASGFIKVAFKRVDLDLYQVTLPDIRDFDLLADSRNFMLKSKRFSDKARSLYEIPDTYGNP